MDYEKKYKELIEKIELISHSALTVEQHQIVDTILGELKESKDERIRKAIHIYLDWLDGRRDYQPKGDFTIKDMIAWLEKQGEQKASYTTLVETGNGGINALVTGEVSTNDYEEKPVGKVEPKFHSGEWITNGDYTWKIIDVKPLDYILQSQDGNIVDDTISHVDEQFNLWTIQDAKPGDVLVYKGDIKYSNGIKYEQICLFNNLDNAFFTLTKTSNYKEGYDIDVNIDYPDNIVPATKEQKEILFMAMKEAGYIWDAEKKELKKISQRMISADAKEAMYDKPAWSEEDEKMLECALDMIEWYSGKNEDKSRLVSGWLKSLKQRIGG